MADDRDGDALLRDPTTMAPARRQSVGEGGAPLKCCCGSAECIFLTHNYSVLDSVEKDVVAAARMGKVRLSVSLSCVTPTPPIHMSPCTSIPYLHTHAAAACTYMRTYLVSRPRERGLKTCNRRRARGSLSCRASFSPSCAAPQLYHVGGLPVEPHTLLWWPRPDCCAGRTFLLCVPARQRQLVDSRL